MSSENQNTKGSKLRFVSIGFAMFSMFFGAGNIVFPIVLGQHAGQSNPYAYMGLFITGVVMPFVALATMLSFNANYWDFFNRIGKVPGFVVAVITMGLLGPFGAIPRCIAVAHSTLNVYVPNLTLTTFSVIACIIVLLLSLKQNKVVDILGIVLTPLLLISLAVIIIRGMIYAPAAPDHGHNEIDIFWHGFTEGYKTMDLFAALFFSTIIIPVFRDVFGNNLEQQKSNVANLAVKSSLVGVALLGAIYGGMSFIASYYGELLTNVPIDRQLAVIANLTLGEFAGLIVNSAVSIACLTTAIALTVVFAEFVRKDVLCRKVGYFPILVATILVTFYMSSLGFSGIGGFLMPILSLIYPAVIVLTIVNLAYRFFDFKPVKIPVYLTLFVTILVLYWPKG